MVRRRGRRKGRRAASHYTMRIPFQWSGKTDPAGSNKNVSSTDLAIDATTPFRVRHVSMQYSSLAPTNATIQVALINYLTVGGASVSETFATSPHYLFSTLPRRMQIQNPNKIFWDAPANAQLIRVYISKAVNTVDFTWLGVVTIDFQPRLAIRPVTLLLPSSDEEDDPPSKRSSSVLSLPFVGLNLQDDNDGSAQA